MLAIAQIIQAVEWVSMAIRAGREAHAALQELKERIQARGEAFDYTDVDFFKAKAKQAMAESQAAIDAMP